jgi:RNA polymerase sigma-70 factor (ECF subfamily)
MRTDTTAARPAPVAPSNGIDEQDQLVDPAIIDRAKGGDEAAFTELYVQHFDRVYAYMRMALNDASAAEEATQKVFMTAVRELRQFDADKSEFSTWLFEIAHSQAVEQLRNRAARDEEAAPKAVRRSPAEFSEDELRALRVTSDENLILLIDCLPEAQRQAIVLNHVLDFKGSEIAKLLGRSERAVRQLERRGVSFLRERLAAVGREAGSAGRHPMRRFRARRGALRPAHTVTLLR